MIVETHKWFYTQCSNF